MSYLHPKFEVCDSRGILTLLMQWRGRPGKLRPERDLKPLRCRCSALPVELVAIGQQGTGNWERKSEASRETVFIGVYLFIYLFLILFLL